MIDTIRYQVVTVPLTRFWQIILGPPTGHDMWSSLVGSADVNDLEAYSQNDVVGPAYVNVLSSAGSKILARLGLNTGYFGFNFRRPPLDDVNFRHALAHLLDKDWMIGTQSYTAVRDDSLVPPAMGRWFNPMVDPHPFDRLMAVDILTTAGYYYDMDCLNWRDPSGRAIPPLSVLTPTNATAPEVWAIGSRWVAAMNSIGLNSISHVPGVFTGLGGYLPTVYDSWNFDIYWVSESFGRWPDFLYDIAHSSQNYLGSVNPTGISYPALDVQLEILKHNLDSTDVLNAAMSAQELLMGGSIYDPLGMPAQPGRSQAIPYLPVYAKNYFSACDPRLSGLINAYGWGIDNMWTHLNMYWDTPGQARPGSGLIEMEWIVPDNPERLNPAYAKTVYDWTYMDPVFDGLIAHNPWNLKSEPWMATNWEAALYNGPENGYVDGMYVQFTLRTTDSEGLPITWQDGIPVSPADVKFAWEFIRDRNIPKYEYFSTHITDVTTSGNDVTAYFDTTSLWFPYDLSRTALMFPRQIWDQPWANTAAILAYDPSTVAYTVAPGYAPGPTPPPTNLFGTGPFILQHSTTFITTWGFGDLDANRAYWLATSEIQPMLVDMFYEVGDLNRDSVIDIIDLFKVAIAWASYPGNPRWDPEADLNNDEFIDVEDLVVVGRYFGETREV